MVPVHSEESQEHRSQLLPTSVPLLAKQQAIPELQEYWSMVDRSKRATEQPGYHCPPGLGQGATAILFRLPRQGKEALGVEVPEQSSCRCSTLLQVPYRHPRGIPVYPRHSRATQGRSDSAGRRNTTK